MKTDQSRHCCICFVWIVRLLSLLRFVPLNFESGTSGTVVSAFDLHSGTSSSTPHYRHQWIRSSNSATTLLFPQRQLKFRLQESTTTTTNDDDDNKNNIEDGSENGSTGRPNYELLSRRRWLVRSAVVSSVSAVPTMIMGSSTVATAATTTTTMTSSSVYVPAVRPTVYRVDSTIPPTLLPVPKNQDQKKLLKDLGRGLGTDKKEVFIDRINLNNMLQKAVYGTVDAVKSVTTSSVETQKAPASFVCLGLPMQVTNLDIDLTVSLLRGIFEKRLSQSRASSAIGIATMPCTAQGIVDDLVAKRIALSDVSTVSGGDAVQQLLPLYRPILEYAIENQIPIIAMGLSKEDEQIVQKGGIQSVNPTSREKYVKDPNGFIAATSDPAFKLYTDRSLLKDRLLVAAKDASSSESTISEGNYFAERILSHEAGATLVSQYAIDHRSDDCCVIAIVAPINDVRYLGGINGRIPRVYQYLSAATATDSTETTATRTSTENPESLVSMNDITTILVNPTAIDTLSRTKRLRLEIGTGPDTISYQTKIADYLWFSSSPPVSVLPRVMDY